MLQNNFERDNYGPWNALADILGTYLQKRSVDGAMKEAAQYDQQAAQMQDPGWEQNPVPPTKEGAQAYADTWARMKRDGQMVDFDWLHKMPQAQPKYGMDAAMASVAGPIGAPAQSQQYSFKAPSLVDTMASKYSVQAPSAVTMPSIKPSTSVPFQSALNSSQQAQTAPAQQTLPAQSAAPVPPDVQKFRDTKAAHPEWFVGNVYTGYGAPHDAAQKAYDAAVQNNASRPAIGGSLNDMRSQLQNNMLSYQNPDKAAVDAMAHQQKQAEYDNYAANMKAHPEWFAGNTYIGDKLNGDKAHDDKVRQDALAAEQGAQAKKDQEHAQLMQGIPHTDPYQFKTGMEQYGFTGRRNKPLTYDEYVTKLKSSKTQLISRLVHKYGIEAAGKAEKMIDDSINNHISEYGDKLLSTALQGINQSMFQQDKNGQVYRRDMSIPSNKLAFLQQVQAYDNAAQRMGKPTYDTKVLASILSMDNVKNVNIDSGAQIHILTVPANGGKFDDGKTVHESVVLPKQETPNNLMNRKTKVAITKANNAMKKYVADTSNATKLKTAQMSANARITAAKISASSRGSRSGGGGGGNHAYNHTVDKVLHQFDLAEQSVRNGKTFSDDDDHNVQELNDGVNEAIESGNLSDAEKEALIERKNQFDVMYQQARQEYDDNN